MLTLPACAQKTSTSPAASTRSRTGRPRPRSSSRPRTTPPGAVRLPSPPRPSSALTLTDAPTVTVNLPASTYIEYKYINVDGSTIIWESDPNNSITTPASGTYTVNDTWR